MAPGLASQIRLASREALYLTSTARRFRKQKCGQHCGTAHFGQAMLKTCMPANLEPLNHRHCDAFLGYVILDSTCWPMNHGWFMGRHSKTKKLIHKYVNRKTYANPYWIANKIKQKRSESIWLLTLLGFVCTNPKYQKRARNNFAGISPLSSL